MGLFVYGKWLFGNGYSCDCLFQMVNGLFGNDIEL